jgi:hypothetical protein
MGPRAGLDMKKRLFLTLPGLEFRPLSRPVRSQSLYRLRYPDQRWTEIILFNEHLDINIIFLDIIDRHKLLHLKKVKGKVRYRYPCYRPWRPIGLREVEAPTLLRQTANRWRQGCQPCAPAALYPQVYFLRFLVLISVRG